MTRSENPKPTKELILDAAFSFLVEPRFSTFSMNELAAKVGISKPAIYRHFKNKEAVLAAMEMRVIDGMEEYLCRLNPDSAQDVQVPLAGLIDYFIKNPAYINYIIAQMSSTANYEAQIFKNLWDRNIPFVKRHSSNDSYLQELRHDVSGLSRHVFSGMTIFFFVKVFERLYRCGEIARMPENLSQHIVDLMLGGLSGTTSKDDFMHPCPLSEERKAEIISLCKISPETFPKENRIFTALANVIEKYKMTGVTVERIAAELNMAKSSLYEYFDNKNEMVRTLIKKELAILQTIIVENSAEAKSFTEYVYILMLSELEYFLHRPSIIPISGWLLMGGTDIHDDGKSDAECKNSPWELRLPERIIQPDLGCPYSPEVITGWIKCLPVAFLIEAKGKKINREKCMEAFMLTIDFILNGIGGGTK